MGQQVNQVTKLILSISALDVSLALCLRVKFATTYVQANSSPPYSLNFTVILRESPCGVMAKALECDLEISNFKLYSPYYVYFWT